MFSLFRKKNKQEPIHEVFGKLMIKSDSWHSYEPFLLKLWDYTYPLEVYGPLDNGTQWVFPVQEETFLRFSKNPEENQAAIQRAIETYCHTASPAMTPLDFTPTRLLLSSNGECAVEGLNEAEDEDLEVPDGLTVVVYPKASVVNRDEYYDSVFE